MKQKIILYNNPILRKKSLLIKQINKSVHKLAADMIETMRCNNGVGISAIQIGVPKRMVAYAYQKSKGAKKDWPNIPLKVLINPQIVKVSKKQTVDEEGCLSFPELYGEVFRPSSAKIKALTLEGKTIEFDVKGLEAKVVQHEIDHLDGILFIDRLVQPGKLYTYEIKPIK